MAEQITMPLVESVVPAVEPVTPAPLVEEPPVTPPPAAEPVVETPPVEETPEQKRHRSAQARIDKAIRSQREAERERDRVKQELEAERAGKTTMTEPKAEDFATTEEYVKAVTKWEVQEARKSDAQQEHIRRQQEEVQVAMTRFEPQMDAARLKHDDFDDVTSAPIYGPATQQLLYHSPHGAEIAYYLGTHPQEADKINRMSVVEATRAIVKLEQRFEAPSPKKVSAAPEPITPVTGTVSPSKDPEKMTTAEWMEWEKKQKMERLKANPLGG